MIAMSCSVFNTLLLSVWSHSKLVLRSLYKAATNYILYHNTTLCKYWTADEYDSRVTSSTMCPLRGGEFALNQGAEACNTTKLPRV